MARHYNGTSDFSECSKNLGIKGTPFSMACWFFRVDAAPNVLTAMSLGDSFAGSNWHRLFFFGSGAGGNNAVAVQSGIAGTGSPNVQSTNGTPAQNAWGHMAGVWASDTSRSAYVNGGGKATDTTSISPTGLAAIDIGRNIGNASTGEFMSGNLADCAIWNCALTDLEVQLLASGVRPNRIRPINLVGWWNQMDGLSFERNLVINRQPQGSQILTGTTLVNNAPHIIKWTPPSLKPWMIPGAPAAPPPWFDMVSAEIPLPRNLTPEPYWN